MWLQRLQRWIAELFRPKKKRRRASPRVLMRWDRNFTVVLRLERSTPGGIATYRITSRYADECDFLITLDYLPELFSELVGEFDGTVVRLGHFDYPSNPATHRFAIFRLGHDGSNRPVGIWDVDLQGFCQNFSLRDLAPKRAVRGVALRSLQVVHSAKTPDMAWQSQMNRMDWLGSLEERIRGELSNSNHNLKACVILSTQQSGNLA
ncbi:hypothetical protein [Nostoc linckia]|uniref:Uncharacterized protein n=2 Tax=Nostoc linckia TaxID=92942 RepID=A0A9Q5ZEA5_NOSLI|nr:hypothetical protein [Nostoc linckia]PHJ69573.1 hypothetical protein VF03_23530 [Nostoc linckia z2]PHK05336.1 hypothetical protein VF08_08130 [Nostoc linckia z8]PHK42549.1 hypothetical protein VF12_02470 [Nostoc linckia z15]PHK44523.1 hypothetical protein VF13_21170 [Nostoc linckia z16]